MPAHDYVYQAIIRISPAALTLIHPAKFPNDIAPGQRYKPYHQ